MRTKRMTRVSFGDNTINVNMPTRWPELSQEELRMVFGVKAVAAHDAVPTFVFFALSGMRVLYCRGGRFACRCKTPAGKKNLWIDPAVLAELIAPLDFLNEPGAEPVRLDVMRKRHAVDACLHGVPFSDYLKLENLYQGFLSSKDPAILTEMADILYEGKPFGKLHDYEQLNILNWVVQVKNLFASQFSNFFQPAAGETSTSMLDVMNCEIRALTGGDVTKEDTILNTDCWRALTELDFLAKEAEEFRRTHKKT